ncbi:hypothetical protein CHS0354_040378 [Potamilus streckersoni]|uniref:Uncharacterized protein n=1 Tax=Potamilus streckersoni TaxID=2493646 RepID=A0AAE0VMT2_9BIVA|nr:hypothetical protein CHS0354_040378 [Potamilus streckersoni]
MATFGLVRNATDNTSDLDRLIQSYECENQQYVKLIEKENQVINGASYLLDMEEKLSTPCVFIILLSMKKEVHKSSLEKDLAEKQAETIQLQSAISKLDEDTKFFHRQFKQNRENCESLKQTRTLLHEHEQVLQKKLQAVCEQGQLERSERDGILEHYRTIWQDYEAKYKSLPLTRKLLMIQEQVRVKDLKLKDQKEKLGQLREQFSSLKDAEEFADLHIFIIKLYPVEVQHSDETVKTSETDVEVEQRMESDQELISFNLLCSPIINECSESEDGSKAMQTGDSSTGTINTQDRDVSTHRIMVEDGYVYQGNGSQVEVPASEAELNVVAVVESHTITSASSENKCLKQPSLIMTPQISRLIQSKTPTIKTGSASPQHRQMPETPRMIPHVLPSPKPATLVHPPSRIPIIPQKPTSKFLQFQSAVRSIAPPVSPCVPRNAAAKLKNQPPARAPIQPNMPSSNTSDSNQAFKRNATSESHGNKSPVGDAQHLVSQPIVPPSPIIPPVFYNSYIRVPPSPSVPQIASLSSLQTNGSQSQHQQIKKFVTQPTTPKPCQISLPVQAKPIISPPKDKSHENNISASSEDLQMQQSPKTPEHQRAESLMDISLDDSNSPFSFEKHKQRLYQMYRSPGCDLYREQRLMFSSHDQTSNDESTEQEPGGFESMESLLSTGVPFDLLGSPGSSKDSSDLPKNASPVKKTSTMSVNIYGGARLSSPTSPEANQHITFKFGDDDNRDGINSRGSSSLQSLFGGGGDADPATHNKNCGFSFTFGSSDQDNDLPRQGSSILSLFGSGSGASKAQDNPNSSGFSFNFGASNDKDEESSPTFRLF